MGINGFLPSFSGRVAVAGLVAPVQAVIGLFWPFRPVRPESHGNRALSSSSNRRVYRSRAIELAPWRHGATHTARTGTVAAKSRMPGRLKVRREYEPGISPSFAGRMVISGRMSDVCAEIERLAQPENAAF